MEMEMEMLQKILDGQALILERLDRLEERQDRLENYCHSILAETTRTAKRQTVTELKLADLKDATARAHEALSQEIPA